MAKIITSLFCGALALALLLAPEHLNQWISSASAESMKIAGPGMQYLMLISFVIAIALAFTPFARQKIGNDSAREFDFFGWQALIICTLLAGGGLFWSAAEPVYHRMTVPPLLGPENSPVVALAQSHLLWGFLAWSILGALGVVSLFNAQKAGLALRPRALLYPWVSRSVLESRWGDVVDGFCFLSVVAGTVGPIGFLGIQLGYLFEALYGVPSSISLQVMIILALTALYTGSAISGVTRGMKWLSQLNISLSFVLGLLTLIFLGPFIILSQHIEAQQLMIAEFFSLSLSDQGDAWMGSWTWFYWAWFIGYAPMMSIIVTRVSRGRSLRQIILSVSILCPLVTNFWFSIIGGGLMAVDNFETEVIQNVSTNGLPAALTNLVLNLPFPQWIGILFCLLIFAFLATTGDSVSYSLSVASAADEHPPKKERVYWSLVMGFLAIALLVVGGDKSITSFQSVIVLTAIPVALLMVFPVMTAIQLVVRKQ